MGTDRTLRKKPLTRPVKRNGPRARRLKVQRARLVALGMDVKAVAKLTSLEVRTLLLRPLKVTEALKAGKTPKIAVK